VNAGLDPDNLPQSGPEAMSFATSTGAKAWRDIWGSGQGIGVIDKVQPTGALVAEWTAQYGTAKARLGIS
jgi:nitronate monooxygenase